MRGHSVKELQCINCHLKEKTHSIENGNLIYSSTNSNRCNDLLFR